MNSILDACAMIAYLQGHPGGTVVEAILTDAVATAYAHSINLCEVYYHFLRLSDEGTASQAVDDLLESGVIERQDMSRAF
ncbi:hypothetical protein SAMN05444166_7809 [Singulisphaera sp. GP187]|uniref:PIN domain-containing protein n=1 Tax=Singulisphaera sp. GP187 TaxID=1882752 RepID=UPI00092993D7|nr:PIN domain-containing protein [Singulisphaera sp. GP187]SIO65728.1 hypothetical protein SAMN05444166_7809 [Singulisphaera sp. GP187]